MQSQQRPHTGEEALQWAASFLREREWTKRLAQQEARLLLAKAWQKDFLHLVIERQERLSDAAWEAFALLVKQRGAQEPLHYLLGEKEFMSLPIQVSSAVLIPRWETEVMVEEALKLMRERVRPRILELGTGSGAIALSLAYYLPKVEVVAIDVSEEALEVARKNAVRLGLKKKIIFLQGDLFQPLTRGERFDLIISNPPYLSAAEMQNLPPDVQKEPVLALAGGQDGLAFYRRIAAAAQTYLLPEGHLLLEIGWQQGAAVTAILAEKGLAPVKILRDLEERERVVVY